MTYQIWGWFETFKGNVNWTNTVNYAHWTSGAKKGLRFWDFLRTFLWTLWGVLLRSEPCQKMLELFRFHSDRRLLRKQECLSSFGTVRISAPRSLKSCYIKVTGEFVLQGYGFISSFDASWCGWSWITDPDPDHPKGTDFKAHAFNLVAIGSDRRLIKKVFFVGSGGMHGSRLVLRVFSPRQEILLTKGISCFHSSRIVGQYENNYSSFPVVELNKLHMISF